MLKGSAEDTSWSFNIGLLIKDHFKEQTALACNEDYTHVIHNRPLAKFGHDGCHLNNNNTILGYLLYLTKFNLFN